MGFRKGRMSMDEVDFVQSNAHIMTPEQIAKELNRDSLSIKKYLKEKMGVGIGSDMAKAKHAEYDLKTRPFWSELQSQFSKSELELLIYHWGRIISQFKD